MWAQGQVLTIYGSRKTLQVCQPKCYHNYRQPWNTTGSMRLLNWEIYQPGRVAKVADTELVLVIAHLNPITRLNFWWWAGRNQTTNYFLLWQKKMLIAPTTIYFKHINYKSQNTFLSYMFAVWKSRIIIPRLQMINLVSLVLWKWSKNWLAEPHTHCTVKEFYVGNDTSSETASESSYTAVAMDKLVQIQPC